MCWDHFRQPAGSILSSPAEVAKLGPEDIDNDNDDDTGSRIAAAADQTQTAARIGELASLRLLASQAAQKLRRAAAPDTLLRTRWSHAAH